MPVDDSLADEAPDAGALLRAAREAAGLSVEQVAQQLRLTVRLVEAIEANDRHGFPAMAYLRGYARSYARLLGIDPEPLLAAYAREAPEPSEPVMVQPQRVGREFPRIPAAMIGGGLLVLVVLLLIVWQWPADEGSAGPVGDTRPSAGVDSALAEENSTAPTANDVAREAGAQASSADAGVANDPVVAEQVHFPELGSTRGDADRTGTGAVADDAIVPAESIFPEQMFEDVISPAFDPEAALVEDVTLDGVESDAAAVGEEGPAARDAGDGVLRSLPPAPATSGSTVVAGSEYQDSRATDDLLRVRRITSVGDDELWFEFTEDCWVEVFNTEGQTLYEDLLRRRQSLRLVGSPPFQIRLGYAPGVTLEYNGEPVPLGPHTRNNMATLVLGQ